MPTTVRYALSLYLSPSFPNEWSLLISLFKSGHIELGDVTPHNIRQLKKLNSVVFPIAYTDKVSQPRQDTQLHSSMHVTYGCRHAVL